jgi:hypothetical protein
MCTTCRVLPELRDTTVNLSASPDEESHARQFLINEVQVEVIDSASAINNMSRRPLGQHRT